MTNGNTILNDNSLIAHGTYIKGDTKEYLPKPVREIWYTPVLYGRNKIITSAMKPSYYQNIHAEILKAFPDIRTMSRCNREILFQEILTGYIEGITDYLGQRELAYSLRIINEKDIELPEWEITVIIVYLPQLSLEERIKIWDDIIKSGEEKITKLKNEYWKHPRKLKKVAEILSNLFVEVALRE